MDYRKYITIDSGTRSGKPCIKGSRITVGDVLDYLAAGMSVERIIREHRNLTEEGIRAALAYAADIQRRLATGTLV
ncbi:MAG: DUF433 domain-containing protein [Planctomycetes bacterium]|nr:DUF433 domain-containing protein [Planctomycetota bacterium]